MSKIYLYAVGIAAAAIGAGYLAHRNAKKQKQEFLQELRALKDLTTTKTDTVDTPANSAVVTTEGVQQTKKSAYPTVDDLEDLIAKHQIRQHQDGPIPGGGDYLDSPVHGGTFYGYDSHGRLFLNIAAMDGGRTRSFVIHQRYTDTREVLVSAGHNGFPFEGPGRLTHEDLAIVDQLLTNKEYSRVDENHHRTRRLSWHLVS